MAVAEGMVPMALEEVATSRIAPTGRSTNVGCPVLDDDIEQFTSRARDWRMKCCCSSVGRGAKSSCPAVSLEVENGVMTISVIEFLTSDSAYAKAAESFLRQSRCLLKRLKRFVANILRQLFQ